jgi:hypothetical protein
VGIELAKMASAKWGHVGYSPFRILIRMCVQALDKPNSKGDPAGIYFGGWEDLALALGRTIDDPEQREKIRHEVIRHTRTLKQAGAIKPLVDNPRQGDRQMWKLTL